jgi:hypothetical protein
MPSREEILEAAHLARMVGTHLSQVDHFTTERGSAPANKIKMEDFVAPLMGRQNQPQQGSYMTGATPNMIKAYAGVNEQALAQVPDHKSNMTPVPPVASPGANPSVVQAVQPVAAPVAEQRVSISSTNTITKSDIDSIRNSLSSISKTLSSILKHLTSK